MSKKLISFLAIFLGLVILTGCFNNDKTFKEKESDKKDIEEKEPEIVQEQHPQYYYPLTGLPTEKEPDHQAIGVMINNHPNARPQSGLHKADVVIEALAEGGITRFLAIFHSEFPEKIGPVRSARDYYIYLAKGFDSLFVFHGWSPSAKALIESKYIESLNGLYYDGTLFQRAAFRRAPHNSYITYDNILKGAKMNHYKMDDPPEPYVFLNENESIIGEDAKTITISYSNKSFEVRYEYNSVSEKYERFSGNEQTIDLDTKEPIQLDNILIIEMQHRFLNDGSGRRSLDLTSGGKGYLLQKGKLQKIEWKNEDGLIIPYINNEKARFVPGKTWINIIPHSLEERVSY